MEHILSAYVMENIDTTNGLERFPELMWKLTLDSYPKYLKKRSKENRLTYTVRRNFYVSFWRNNKNGLLCKSELKRSYW